MRLSLEVCCSDHTLEHMPVPTAPHISHPPALLPHSLLPQTGVQRVAVATAANMCRGLTSEHADAATSAAPILISLLQYQVRVLATVGAGDGRCRGPRCSCRTVGLTGVQAVWGGLLSRTMHTASATFAALLRMPRLWTVRAWRWRASPRRLRAPLSSWRWVQQPQKCNAAPVAGCECDMWQCDADACPVFHIQLVSVAFTPPQLGSPA